MTRNAARLLAPALSCLLFGCSRGPAPLVIGSKPFTESELAGEMLALLAESRGIPVKRRFYLGGTLCFDALRAGKLDAYVEYTGTGLVNLLGEPPLKDPRAAFARVREEFRRRWSLEWLEPLGFNNSYALVLRGTDARRLGVSRLSELRKFPKTFRCGFDLEFADRPDGYKGMVERAGAGFCSSVRQMAPGLMYEAAASKQVDLISGYATDGRIAGFGLAALQDDLGFFPPYEACPLIAPGAARKAPGVAELWGRLAGRIDGGTMTRLNAEVDVRKRAPREVAREFLAAAGLLR